MNEAQWDQQLHWHTEHSTSDCQGLYNCIVTYKILAKSDYMLNHKVSTNFKGYTCSDTTEIIRVCVCVCVH